MIVVVEMVFPLIEFIIRLHDVLFKVGDVFIIADFSIFVSVCLQNMLLDVIGPDVF